jgi:hypothetical protein
MATVFSSAGVAWAGTMCRFETAVILCISPAAGRPGWELGLCFEGVGMRQGGEVANPVRGVIRVESLEDYEESSGRENISLGACDDV